MRMIGDLRLALGAASDADVIRHLITEGYALEYPAIERAKADRAARDARQLKLPSVDLGADPILDRAVVALTDLRRTQALEAAAELREVSFKEQAAHEVADAVREALAVGAKARQTRQVEGGSK